ncbi:MAG: adenylate/guanylate cyclase domain-containing protein [Acidobacteriia bacterium]|nr:adenylate/guanylate cyclase domain-containing protein [Terriglobia bacterium]
MLPSVSEPYLIDENSARRYALGAGQSWAIGRGDGCAVTLESRSVSRLHALIQRRDQGDFSLVDLGSLNGSFLNGRRVSFPVVLGDGDRLTFGDRVLLFHHPSGPKPSAAELASAMRDTPTTAIHTHTLTTIVVVDIRDFTPLARSLPEALLSQTVGTWFLRAGQAAERCGSWAQKYFGDAVMAVWVHEEPARVAADIARALRAVCEIESATREVSRALSLPAPLRVGAGVNTGPAIVGGSGYTALGDTVNLAFRLQDATKTLCVDVALGEPSFEAMARPRPPFERREVLLKGYESPSGAWGISFQRLRDFLGPE